jgi:hypothetical protein
MKDIAIVYICAQQSHQEALSRPYVPSLWKSSIEAKIQKIKNENELLGKAMAKEKLDAKSKSEAIRIMRNKGLILEKPVDIQNTIISNNDSIDMYEKRKIFRQENRKYEFFSRKF